MTNVEWNLFQDQTHLQGHLDQGRLYIPWRKTATYLWIARLFCGVSSSLWPLWPCSVCPCSAESCSLTYIGRKGWYLTGNQLFSLVAFLCAFHTKGDFARRAVVSSFLSWFSGDRCDGILRCGTRFLLLALHKTPAAIFFYSPMFLPSERYVNSCSAIRYFQRGKILLITYLWNWILSESLYLSASSWDLRGGNILPRSARRTAQHLQHSMSLTDHC